jgi:hypothetical protein
MLDAGMLDAGHAGMQGCRDAVMVRQPPAPKKLAWVRAPSRPSPLISDIQESGPSNRRLKILTPNIRKLQLLRRGSMSNILRSERPADLSILLKIDWTGGGERDRNMKGCRSNLGLQSVFEKGWPRENH